MKKLASITLLGALAIPVVFAAKTETKPAQSQQQAQTSSKKRVKHVRKHQAKKNETKKS